MMHRPDPKADRWINVEKDKELSTKRLYPSLNDRSPDLFQRESWVGKTCPCIRLVWEAQC
jgi:hypothetical protein